MSVYFFSVQLVSTPPRLLNTARTSAVSTTMARSAPSETFAGAAGAAGAAAIGEGTAGCDAAGYDWEIEHWGCKWGACNSQLTDEWEGHLTYLFDSAWSPPLAFRA